MKIMPDATLSLFLLTFLSMILPANIARMEISSREIIMLKKTKNGLNCAANRPDAIWVLSPISEIKIMVNPDMKGFLNLHLSSFSLLFDNISIPNIMKIMPERNFIMIKGIKSAMVPPNIIAIPSAIMNPSITPDSKARCLFVWEARQNTAI